MERDEQERKFIHDFPRVPEAKHFWQCALIERRTATGLPHGISLTKLPNHACIMRFNGQKVEGCAGAECSRGGIAT